MTKATGWTNAKALSAQGRDMLTVDRITRQFSNGTIALHDTSLRLTAGDFVALLGPSGCGKSTLLRLIANLDLPDSGRINWDGGSAPMPGDIGYVFQDPTLMPWASAEMNVFLPLRLRGIAWTTAREAVGTALRQVGLEGFRNALPHQLSGGMRMRVSIARALVTRPRLLLLDEPFAALDEFTRHKLQQELLNLWCSIGCTIIFVTHSIYEAAYLAQRLVLMSPRPGRIAREIPSPLDPRHANRLDPAYALLVAEVTATMDELGQAG